MIKTILITSAVSATSAFIPTSSSQRRLTKINVDVIESESLSETGASALLSTSAEETKIDPINGWVPDASKPCFGLPGAIAPTGFFDPLGFCQAGITLNEVKRYREAEVQHGRVAMLATVGYLAGEAVQGPFSITGPANDQLQQVPLPAFILLSIGIAAAELKRATIGWVEPGPRNLWTLRDTYYPGDVGFDPLNLKPETSEAFSDMQTRELQNGRLAMIGWAGMCSQELFNHKGILETLVYYQKVYSGIDPYTN